MKNKMNVNCLYLIGIAIFLLIVALCGYPISNALEAQFNEQLNPSVEEIILIILLLPIYLVMWLVQAAAIEVFKLFVVIIPFISGLIILTCALVTRFLFSPENGHYTGYKVLTAVGYACAILASLPCAFTISGFAFPLGAIIAILCLIFFFKLCSKGWELTFSEIAEDELSFYSDLPHDIYKPAILFDTDFRIHTVNNSANQYYKTLNTPELKGLNICNFLTDEECAKLRSSAQLIRDNQSLERFVLSNNDADNYNLILSAVRAKNKKLVGFLIKHE